ncbi:MAG: HAD family phosphatase, partial [Chloroflexi bacterium]|nr:HAD family phosphatase [Chloroflexota bacterium]
MFDFDGVIIDTETPIFVAWQEIYRSHGVELERALWEQSIGGGANPFDEHEHLEGLLGRKLDREALKAETRRRYLGMIEANPLLPGILDYIQDARRLGLKLAVASSSPRDWVEGHLGRRGLLRHFDCIRVANDVANIKPHPELYLTAAEKLGARPENALVIEDSFNGVT